MGWHLGGKEVGWRFVNVRRMLLGLVVVFLLSLYIPRLLVIFIDMCFKIQGDFCSGVLNRKKMMFYWIIFFFLFFVFFVFCCLHELFLSWYKHHCLSSKTKTNKKPLCNFSHNYILWTMDDTHIIAQQHQHNVNLIKRHILLTYLITVHA